MNTHSTLFNVHTFISFLSHSSGEAVSVQAMSITVTKYSISYFLSFIYTYTILCVCVCVYRSFPFSFASRRVFVVWIWTFYYYYHFDNAAPTHIVNGKQVHGHRLNFMRYAKVNTTRNRSEYHTDEFVLSFFFLPLARSLAVVVPCCAAVSFLFLLFFFFPLPFQLFTIGQFESAYACAWNKRQQSDNMTPANITVIKLWGDIFTAIPYCDLFVSLSYLLRRRATATTQKNADLLYKDHNVKQLIHHTKNSSTFTHTHTDLFATTAKFNTFQTIVVNYDMKLSRPYYSATQTYANNLS